MSNIGDKIKEGVDKVLHPNKHHDTTGTGTSHTSAGTAHHTAGPHSSNLANKADPRVDSDRDGSHAGQGVAGGVLGGSHAHGGGADPHTRTTAGPHNSDLLNKADPRVDSDRSGHHAGQGAAGGILGGTHGSSTGNTLDPSTRTTAGHHNSDVLNKLDPRVDSDRDGKGALQPGATTSTTHGTNTAGPHNSNLANKLDPRVDSDLDGSRRVGSDDSFDAAKHSPTTARNMLGDPEIQHERDPADHQRRHSLAKGDARNVMK